MRTKFPLIAVLVLAVAGTLAAATQVWVALELREDAAAFAHFAVTGQQLNSSLSPVALAGLAAGLALTIAGRVFRFVLGAVVVLLGVAISAMSVGVLGNPVAVTSARLAEVTGLTGHAQDALVLHASVSAWPTVSLILGVLTALSGAAVLLLAGRWREGGRKYRSASDGGAQGRTAGIEGVDRISEWDTQTSGEDPSEEGVDEAGDVPPSSSQETPSER